MAVPTTRVDPASDETRGNAAAMRTLLAELHAKTRAIIERGAAGDERSIGRHCERGKLPVRERIERLRDERHQPILFSAVLDGPPPVFE